MWTHAHQFFDQEFKHGILVTRLQLGQLLQFGNLNHIRVLLYFGMLQQLPFLSNEHFFLLANLLLLPFQHLLEHRLLLSQSFLYNAHSLELAVARLLHRGCFRKNSTFRGSTYFLFEEHGRRTVGLI